MPRSKPQPPIPTAADEDLEQLVREGLNRAWTAAQDHAVSYVSAKTGMDATKAQLFVNRAMSASE